MARPSTITEKQILEVAQRLFIERGYAVTTAEIAKEAGISEGSIFKRFSTKQKLLMAAMGCGDLDWIAPLASLAGQGEVLQNITTLLKKGIETFQEVMPRMMTLWATKGMSPMELHADPNSPPRQILEALNDYFRQEMELGRVHADDAEIPARMVMGAVANYVFVRMMGLATSGLEVDDYARAVARTMWQGLSPASSKTTEGATASKGSEG